MSDYRVKITVSNARIRRAMENAGFKSVNQMCVQGGMSQSVIGKIIAMKMTPKTRTGKWRAEVLAMADVLCVLPDELFSDTQRTMKLRTNTGYQDVSEAQLERIANNAYTQDRLEDLQDNAAIKEIAEEETEAIINAALETLPPRHAIVLRKHYGLDGADCTLRSVGKDIGVGPERARQIETRALRTLRTLRSPSTSHKKARSDLRSLVDEE